METINNNNKSNHLPWPLLILMGIGGIIIAALSAALVALVAQDHLIVYGVLSMAAIVGGIVVSQNDTDVVSMLVALPLFIIGFSFGFIAGHEHLTLTIALQIAAAVLSFIFSKSHPCRQVLLCYALVLVPLFFVSYFDVWFLHSLWATRSIQIWMFLITILYMGFFAATIKSDWFSNTILADYLKTIRFAIAVIISTVEIRFIHSDIIMFSIFFAAISCVIACLLIRKFVSGKQQIIGYALALLCCASTAIYPSMAIPFLGMLLSFMILDYLCVVIFALVFIEGISWFYYDLDMLLINKSYLLMASGAMFLLMFYYIKRVTK